MVVPFKDIHTNSDLDRVQSNVKLFADSLINLPILDGRLIEGIELTTSATQIDHKLGRVYRGWIIVNTNSVQDVYVSSTTLPQRFLTLTAAGTTTVSLWVF